jgi:hypothetical protein
MAQPFADEVHRLGCCALIGARFCSALVDNARLIVCIGLLMAVLGLLLGLRVGLCVAAALWRQRRLRIRAAPVARPPAAQPGAG